MTQPFHICFPHFLFIKPASGNNLPSCDVVPMTSECANIINLQPLLACFRVGRLLQLPMSLLAPVRWLSPATIHHRWAALGTRGLLRNLPDLCKRRMSPPPPPPPPPPPSQRRSANPPRNPPASGPHMATGRSRRLARARPARRDTLNRRWAPVRCDATPF